MEHINLIANELKNKGFGVFITNLGVETFLNNRPVNNMEVRESLAETFEEIEFTLLKADNGILVKL